ncbi:hypothetical protein IFR05_011366 [Cadophora sp. M221]|nr:hypothetical protein IFR05_011366 [Cadophora sp. M221]
MSITASMLSTGKHSDLLIKCKGRQFKVYRAVVCIQSKPLATTIDGNFKEATTGEIDLDGNDPEIVECMLKFMYNQDYSDGRESDPVTRSAADQNARTAWSSLPSPVTASSAAIASADKGALLTNAIVYIICDQLQIPGLKMLAKTKFEELVTDRWNTSSFVASLKLLYKETMENDRPMKDIAVKTAGKHVKDLCDRGEFVALCKEEGEIAFDVLKASSVVEAPLEACPYCGSMRCNAKAGVTVAIAPLF